MAIKKAKIIEQDGCSVRVLHLEKIRQAQDEMISFDELDRLALTFKILGDPTRLKILLALMKREMCVCDLAVVGGISESATSHQLRRLKDSGLIKQRRDGQILYNALVDDHVADIVEICLTHIRE